MIRNLPRINLSSFGQFPKILIIKPHKESEEGSVNVWVQPRLAGLLGSVTSLCVYLSKLCNIPVPQFSHLQTGNNFRTYFIRFAMGWILPVPIHMLKSSEWDLIWRPSPYRDNQIKIKSVGWTLTLYDCVLIKMENLDTDTHTGRTPCDNKGKD